MKMRKVLISPYQLGALDALNTVVNLPPILEQVPQMDVEGLFYLYMIQAGAEKFVITPIESRSAKYSEFLSKRISFLSEEPYRKVYDIVATVFQSYLPEGYEIDPKFSNIGSVKAFLADLLLSLEKRLDMVCILPIPDPAKVEGILPPELFHPIQNLINTFDSESAKLPLPKSSVLSTNVKIFQEIITSDLFSRYSLMHQELANARSSKNKVIFNIVESGGKLLIKYEKLLYLKPLTISLLPVTAKLIDVVFGKLPGTLAEYSSKLLNNWLKDERRIVLYHFHPKFEEIVRRRILASLGEKEK
ncbi:MAG: hypothetical protein WBD09_10875 [Halobacteriota archaeon]